MPRGEKSVRVVSKEHGVIQIDGTDESFAQDIIRTLHFRITKLTASRGYSTLYNDTPTFSSSLSGSGEFERDFLGVMGSSDKRVDAIPVHISADPQAPWTAVIGYIGYDRDIGRPAQYFCDLHVPQEAFEALLEIQGSARPHQVNASLTTTLWVRDYDVHVPPSGQVCWYLKPGERGDISLPELAKGSITALTWTDVLETQAEKAPPEIKHEAENTNMLQHYSDWSSKIDTLSTKLDRCVRAAHWIVVALAAIALSVLIK